MLFPIFLILIVKLVPNFPHHRNHLEHLLKVESLRILEILSMFRLICKNVHFQYVPLLSPHMHFHSPRCSCGQAILENTVLALIPRRLARPMVHFCEKGKIHHLFFFFLKEKEFSVFICLFGIDRND